MATRPHIKLTPVKWSLFLEANNIDALTVLASPVFTVEHFVMDVIAQFIFKRLHNNLEGFAMIMAR